MPFARADWMASKMTAAESPALLGDDGDAVALAPGLQLFARGGAEGVAGREQHGLPPRLE